MSQEDKSVAAVGWLAAWFVIALILRFCGLV